MQRAPLPVRCHAETLRIDEQVPQVAFSLVEPASVHILGAPPHPATVTLADLLVQRTNSSFMGLPTAAS